MKARLKALAIRALIRAYPSAWRREYGEEMEALLASGTLTVATLVDVGFNAVRQRLRSGRPEIVVGGALLLWAIFWTAWNSIAPLSAPNYRLFNLAQYGLFFTAYFATAYWTTSRKPRSVLRGVLASVAVALVGIAPELILIALHAFGLLSLANIDTRAVQHGRGISVLYTRGSVKPKYLDFELILFPPLVAFVAVVIGLLGAVAGRLRLALTGSDLIVLRRFWEP